MDGVDRFALEAGPANVFFDGVSLGYLGEALMLNIDTSIVPLKGAQAGDTPLDGVVSGGGITLEVPLAETASVRKLAAGIVNAELTGASASTGVLTATAQPTSGDTVTIGTRTYTFRAALTPADGEVLIGIDLTATLLNLSRAILGTGGVPGTDYQVASPHPVITTAVATATTVTVTAANGALLVTTEAGAVLSWGAAALVAGAAGGLLTFKNRVGLSLRTLSKELRVVKIKGGVESTDPDDILIFPEASPGPSQVKIPFHPTQQRLVVVTFMVWPDDQNVWGTVGAAA